jgi:hypothetical protein
MRATFVVVVLPWKKKNIQDERQAFRTLQLYRYHSFQVVATIV